MESQALISLKTKMDVQLQSHLLIMLKYYGTSSHQNLSHHGTELSTIWFQQDSATAHTARASMEVTWEMFPENVISLCGELPWPANSPDLSAHGYFLWGYFKAKVCNLEVNFSDTRKYGEASTGKPVSKFGRVCMQ